MEKFIEDNRIHEGHRGRMRAKLLSHGQRIFDTYELLEMLLYHVVPYKDTNPIAKRLLFALGNLDGVFRADTEELTRLNGVGEITAKFLGLVGGLSDIIGAEVVSGEESDLSSYESVGEFFVDYFMGDEESSVVALFLDSSMRLISFEKLYGNIDYESGGVKPKAFIDHAVKSRAAVVISAHNHPFGPFYPSPGDRETHILVTDALSNSGFVHAEHYIVSGKNYAGIGSIQNFTAKLGQMPAVSQYLDSRNCNDGGTMLRTVDEEKIKPRQSLEYDNYNKLDLDYFVSLLEFVLGDDARSTAVNLLKRYRTIENVFTASESELIAISGERCAFYLKLLAYVTARRRTEQFKPGCNYSEAEIADYLKALFLGDSVEKIYLLTFDNNGALTDCQLMAEGTVTSSEVIPRKAVEAAVSKSAVSVSIAHNHPMGNPKASEDDLNITKMLANLFDSCDIKLNSHYIIAGQLCSVISTEQQT